MSVLKVNNIQPFTSGATVTFGQVSFPSGVVGALNATTLDSQSGAYYRDAANLTGTINATQLNSQPDSYYLNLANVTGTLPVSKGGSGATTLSGILKGNGTAAFSAATAGTDYVVSSSPTVFTATQTFSGTTSGVSMVLNDAAEVVTVTGVAAGSTINYDVTTQSVLYYTSNATGNWTTNLRASSGTSLNTALAIGQSSTVVFLVTNGGTAYYNSSVQVDGTTSGVSTKWQGGTAPTAGNASSIDAYSYTAIKTANATFTVLASQTRFA